MTAVFLIIAIFKNPQNLSQIEIPENSAEDYCMDTVLQLPQDIAVSNGNSFLGLLLFFAAIGSVLFYQKVFPVIILIYQKSFPAKFDIECLSIKSKSLVSLWSEIYEEIDYNLVDLDDYVSVVGPDAFKLFAPFNITDFKNVMFYRIDLYELNLQSLIGYFENSGASASLIIKKYEILGFWQKTINDTLLQVDPATVQTYFNLYQKSSIGVALWEDLTLLEQCQCLQNIMFAVFP